MTDGGPVEPMFTVAREESPVPLRGRCGGAERMKLEFSGTLWFWRGPAPWHFVTVPERESIELEATSTSVSYGWGMIPVQASIRATDWTTSLFPKDGRYIVPVKARVRSSERLEIGDLVRVRLTVTQ
jgi:hypothetical protein